MVAEEVRLARKVLGDDPRPFETVIVGGGTPTLLGAADHGRWLLQLPGGVGRTARPALAAAAAALLALAAHPRAVAVMPARPVAIAVTALRRCRVLALGRRALGPLGRRRGGRPVAGRERVRDHRAPRHGDQRGGHDTGDLQPATRCRSCSSGTIDMVRIGLSHPCKRRDVHCHEGREASTSIRYA